VCEPLLQAFPFPSTLGEVTLHLPSHPGVFIYRSGLSPLSCGVFLPPSLLQVFPLLIAGRVPLLLPSLAGLFIYSSVRDSPPPLFSAHGAPPSLLHVFFVIIAYYSVSLFFPGWGSVCLGGYFDLAQDCLWEYHIPLSSPCGPPLLKPSGSGLGALLVSPFNVKWRCCVQAGGVEESKFCLFSVVFPVRCISSIYPRFYFRRHAFCFLPLAAILESPLLIFFVYFFQESDFYFIDSLCGFFWSLFN
jgi:hypothetical protein